MEHMGIHMSQELGWTPSVWGWEGKCRRPGFPPAPGAAGDRLVCGASTASGSPADAETRCDGLAPERPAPAPSPATGLQLLIRLSCSPPRWESSFYQMEGGKQGNGAINFPLQTLLCASAVESASWNGWLFCFYGVTQRVALFIRSVFLLHKHMNWI